jgi:hypothetical protein
MNHNSTGAKGPGPAKGFLRNNWLAMTGITAIVATVGFPLVTVVRNNEAEYQATGDFGALLGHPFDPSAHSAFKTPGYAELIAKYPNLKLSPDDAPEIRAMKITAINARVKATLQAEIDASTIVPRAKITAEEEAKAELIKGQAYVEQMERALSVPREASSAMEISLNDAHFLFDSEIRISPIDFDMAMLMEVGLSIPQNWALRTDTSPPGYHSVQSNYSLAKTLTDPAQTLPSGQKQITPFVYRSKPPYAGKAAWTTNAEGRVVVPVKIESGQDHPIYAFMSAADYDKLGGPPRAPAYTAQKQQP